MILLQNGWSSTFTTIFLGLLINSQTGYSGFYTGRIKEGMFEYSDLNGLMTAEEGATLCEEDLQCAGFTFRGVYSVDVPHELYFFHYVSTIHFSQKNPHFWGWTSYRVNRDYILMRGKLSSPELEVEDLNTWERGSTWELDLNQNPAEAERVCQQTTNCVGLAQFKQERVVMLESVQFWDRSSSENWTTLVSLHPGNNQILDRDTTNINKCCPETPFFTEIDISNTEIPMMIKKIRCNISKEEFLENYVKKRIPVILKGCLNKSWFPNPRSEYQRFAGLSFEETLERLFYRGNETSTTVSRPKLRRRLIETMRKNNFKIDYNKAERLYMESSASVENSSTHSFTHVKTPNDAHFLYKDLVKHRSRGDLRVFLKLSYLKSRLDCYQQYRIPGTLELLPGYEQCLVLDGLWKPPPMPDDLYAITKYNNDLAWIIMSSRNTGSQMHTDPDFMGAWNLLLTGRKWLRLQILTVILNVLVNTGRMDLIPILGLNIFYHKSEIKNIMGRRF
ncbi:uncharacterized protein LOC111708023 isoform X2 [Eurytemora carolleeae]|uniref:uncharacterized protein LOC111708023 isoform X2 n=1 Tax=Eurytemora carolleeae TaxID=1294199 RepID=UPI000C77A346|nr:uncharacterized protein LOC111708023 isoform X2 [Eurytemora carolleeae]|eukprot:XP_023337022.1 uncharacterized protein LOC111708023 isoform X2 [Eurytemora affinis]